MPAKKKTVKYIVKQTFHIGDGTKVKLSAEPQTLTAKQIEIGKKANAIKEA